jgi:hypothetical protein
MHPADETRESRDVSEGAVHKVICPRCQADSSRPEDIFVVHAGVVVPRSDYMLFATECRTCGLFRDAAVLCGASEWRIGDERPRLSGHEGHAKPVIHIYLATELVGVPAC